MSDRQHDQSRINTNLTDRIRSLELRNTARSRQISAQRGLELASAGRMARVETRLRDLERETALLRTQTQTQSRTAAAAVPESTLQSRIAALTSELEAQHRTADRLVLIHDGLIQRIHDQLATMSAGWMQYQRQLPAGPTDRTIIHAHLAGRARRWIEEMQLLVRYAERSRAQMNHAPPHGNLAADALARQRVVQPQQAAAGRRAPRGLVPAPTGTGVFERPDRGRDSPARGSTLGGWPHMSARRGARAPPPPTVTDGSERPYRGRDSPVWAPALGGWPGMPARRGDNFRSMDIRAVLADEPGEGQHVLGRGVGNRSAIDPNRAFYGWPEGNAERRQHAETRQATESSHSTQGQRHRLDAGSPHPDPEQLRRALEVAARNHAVRDEDMDSRISSSSGTQPDSPTWQPDTPDRLFSPVFPS